MDVFFLEAVEGEGAAAAVMDGLWRLVLLCAVDADNFVLSAAEERAVATRPPLPPLIFALKRSFLWALLSGRITGYCAVDDCCNVGCVITEFMSVVGVCV